MISFRDHEVRPSEHLAVAFTGVSQGLGGIPFEFHKSLGQLDCAALFVSDPERRWYQYDDAELRRAADQIEQARTRSGARRVLFLGNSMGGFGAMLFATLCRADAVLAFAPQSAIDPVVTRRLGDERWTAHQSMIPAFPLGDLAALPAPTAHVVLCVGSQSELDMAHMDHIAAAWPVERIEVADSKHDASAKLKARGELIPLIAGLLTGAR